MRAKINFDSVPTCENESRFADESHSLSVTNWDLIAYAIQLTNINWEFRHEYRHQKKSEKHKHETWQKANARTCFPRFKDIDWAKTSTFHSFIQWKCRLYWQAKFKGSFYCTICNISLKSANGKNCHIPLSSTNSSSS